MWTVKFKLTISILEITADLKGGFQGFPLFDREIFIYFGWQKGFAYKMSYLTAR